MTPPLHVRGTSRPLRAVLPCLAAACLCPRQACGARRKVSLDDLSLKGEGGTGRYSASHGLWEQSCGTCSQDLAFDRTFGLEWVIFPPSPFPNPITTLICTPDPSSDRWLPGYVSEDTDNTSKVCGGPEMLEAMSDEDREKCLKATEYVQKAELEKQSYAITVWVKQMWRCGSCAICGIWDNLKALWSGAKTMVLHMVTRFRHKYVGHAPVDDITTMGRRINDMLAATRKLPGVTAATNAVAATNDSLIELNLDSFPTITDGRLKQQLLMFQSELHRHWGGMEEVARERHMSLLERSLANISLVEDELLYQQADKLHQKIKSKAEGIPDVLKRPECEEALKGASMHRTLEISINIEYPDLVNFLAAFLLPIPQPEAGLMSLIPQVLVMAIPKTSAALKKDMMQECVDLLNVEQERFLQSCSSVENFMACTSTMTQRVFSNLVYQQWWPVGAGHDTGEAKPSRAVDTMVKAFRGSCLDNQLMKDKHADEKDILSNTNENWLKFERFEQMACPFVRNLVDEADGGDGLPKVGDKVWIASLRGFSETISNNKSRALQKLRKKGTDTRQCPEVMPFAAAFCADMLSCVSDADVAGKRRGKRSHDFEHAIQDIMTEVDSDHDGVLSEAESSRAWGLLERMLKKQQKTPFKMGREEEAEIVRAGVWHLMWRSVNATFGGPGGWQAMAAAMRGDGDMDWGVALQNWRRVYDFLYRELMQAEKKYKGHGLSSDRMLYEVLHDLDAGYTSTICKPEGLVDMGAHELRTLGVGKAAINDFMDFRRAGMQKEAEMIPGAGWRRLLITSRSEARRTAFQKDLESFSCHCMCYQKSGVYWGTKMKFADKPTCKRVDQVSPGSVGSLVPPLAVDKIKVMAPGAEDWQKVGRAWLSLYPAQLGGECRVTLAWEPLSGEPGGIGYISPCKPPFELRTSYWGTPSHDFEVVVYNPALDVEIAPPLGNEQLRGALETSS